MSLMKPSNKAVDMFRDTRLLMKPRILGTVERGTPEHEKQICCLLKCNDGCKVVEI